MKDDTTQKPTGNEQKKPFWKDGKLQILIGLPIAAYLIYKLFYPTYSWHEKMTVTVSTPDGEKSGYAVRSITVVNTPAPLAEIGGREITLKGEAVTVDVGGGKYLFALLGAPAGWAGAIYNAVTPGAKGGFSEMDRWASSLRGKGAFELPISKYPTLVTFDDINDPASVERLNAEDLAATFGEGYKLKYITLEITRERMSLGQVQAILDWIIDRKARLGIIEKQYIEPSDFIDWQTLRVIRKGTN